jgi:hypothetical protein
MLKAIGIGLIFAGIVVALFGDVSVGKNRNFISKMVAWPVGRAKWLKVVIGLALFYAGLMFLTH